MKEKREQVVQEYAKLCQEEAVQLLRTLGKIPAPTRQEDRRAAFCKEWFLAQGAKDVSIDRAKNVICKLGYKENGPLVVFAAHTDVVFPDMDPLPMREQEGKLYAPGIGDDTANLVNLMMAAKYLIQSDLKFCCGILIVANACEEGLGNLDGTKELFAAYGRQIREFISFDGYLSQCCNCGVGSHRYQISCKTVGGHSYGNFGNPNAIEILCGLVEKLYQVDVPTEAKTTYNVGVMEGGTTVNSIAQEAKLLYEFRSSSQKCLRIMERELQKVVESCQNKGGDLRVELLGVRPGNGELDQEALERFTARNAKIIQEFYQGEMDYRAFSTDSNVPLSMGILANTIGTVEGGLSHTREEWVRLDSLSVGLKIILSLMLVYTEAL